jgi:hypothetical protein
LIVLSKTHASGFMPPNPYERRATPEHALCSFLPDNFYDVFF